MAAMTIAQIITRGENEGFTPYMIASLVNAQLESAGVEPIRPQMMYNYDSNGMINGTKKQSAQRKYTSTEVEAFLGRWVPKYIAKKTGQAVPTTPQTVEDIDAQVAALLALKSEMQGTINA